MSVLKTLIDGMKSLQIHMLHMLEPVASALVFTECPLLEQTGRAMTPGTSAREAWTWVKDISSGRRSGLETLAGEDLQTLDAFFHKLGEVGRAEQGLLLNRVIRTLEENLEGARSSAGEAERLYGSLGLMVGLMLALLVV